MYNLKITALTPQRDMPSLVKILLKIPGLKPDDISRGLKVPPLNVYSTEKEEDALKLKTVLEKFGAACAIENTKALVKEKSSKKANETATSTEAYLKSRRHHHLKFRRKFWIAIFSFIGVFAFITSFDFSCEIKQRKPNEKKIAPKAKTSVGMPSNIIVVAAAAKANQDLKKDIEKNPYNAEAWKALAKNLEKQGDTAAARQAKESYEKSVKAQQVLTSLAKAFGNKVRVEVTEDAVYYRTGYDFTDKEFDAEAEKLMDSLNVKFPGKNLIIENYTSDNRVQKAKLNSTTQQPKGNNSQK